MSNNERPQPAKPMWEVPLRGAAHWSGVLRRGMSLRLTAMGAHANLAALFYNHEQPLERYNMADTLKAQHTAFLTAGCVCYSDMGRILCSITADDCAETAVFLCSDRAANITGVLVPVDGGYVAR